jgi:hypothetical protein
MDLNTSTYDDQLDSIISYTGGLIQGYCNQAIEATTETIVFNGNGTNLYTFTNFPVNSITSVRYRITPANAWITLATTDYTLINSGSLHQIYFSQKNIKGTANYEVVFNYGYTVIPQDVQITALEIASLIWKDTDIQGGAKGGRLGLASVSEGGINGVSASTSFKDYWNTKWRQVLLSYKRMTF